MDRRIAFEGIENFRDFGGYAGREGRMRSGVFFRSGHHGRATAADLEKLSALGLTLVADLRRANEREREPSPRWPGFSAEVIQNDLAQDGLEEWGEFVLRSELTPETFRQYMLDYYVAAPFQRRHVDLYSRYFRALAETDGAVLAHCSAGKDRTGILCALTQHLAGVDADDILEDYLLTNDMARITARLPMMRQAILETTGRTVSDEALVTALRVEGEYMDRALDAIRARHRSLDGYLEAALGVDAGLRERLAARLVD